MVVRLSKNDDDMAAFIMGKIMMIGPLSAACVRSANLGGNKKDLKLSNLRISSTRFSLDRKKSAAIRTRRRGLDVRTNGISLLHRLETRRNVLKPGCEGRVLVHKLRGRAIS